MPSLAPAEAMALGTGRLRRPSLGCAVARRSNGYPAPMQSIKKKFARKAVKSTAKHTARGTASKLKREPLRATTLLGLGGLIGGVVAWMLARSSAPTVSAS
jgi:hypothetical protein